MTHDKLACCKRVGIHSARRSYNIIGRQEKPLQHQILSLGLEYSLGPLGTQSVLFVTTLTAAESVGC